MPLSLLSLALLGAAVGLGTGCRKSEVVAPQSCDRAAADLREWLGVLAEEGDVSPEIIPDPADTHHFLDRRMPLVPLAPVDERAAPRPDLALLTLADGKIRHDDLVESVREVEAPGNVLKRASDSILSPSFGGGGAGGSWVSHPIVLLVGESERWGDVVAVVEAVRKAGFTTVHFPFAAASRAKTPPLDSPVAKRILALATDANTMPWRRDVAIAEELARANEHCPGVASAFEKEAHDSTAISEQRKVFVEHAADAFFNCSCHGDPSAIRAFAWTRFGRHWGPTSVTHAVNLASPEPSGSVEIVSGSKNATWREMSRRVIEAARRDAGWSKVLVRFVVMP